MIAIQNSFSQLDGPAVENRIIVPNFTTGGMVVQKVTNIKWAIPVILVGNIVLASRASGRYLNTQTLKGYPSGHPPKILSYFLKCCF